jgi:adenine-specific DNA-methyltransferase
MIFKDGKLAEPVTLEAGWAMRNQILSWLEGRETFDSKGQRVIRFFFDAKGRLQYEKERGFVNPQSILRQIASTRKGSEQIEAILGKGLVDFPKPVELIQFLVQLVSDSEDWVMDFFAGSGTTGHAVIALNREDGGRRKFILVEMADYFDTVLLPRIKKVAFTPEWKDGKPKRMATQEEAERSPRIVKVIRLESYEDALNNLTFEEQSSQQALELFRDDYLLSYMLRWETRHSETLLNVEKLQAPFSYKLHLHRDGETRQRPVDLPETFAYLLGLDVQTRRVYPGNAGVSPAQYLVYRGRLRNGRTVVILWRDITGWGVETLQQNNPVNIAAYLVHTRQPASSDISTLLRNAGA